jgi:hypothetical protein
MADLVDDRGVRAIDDIAAAFAHAHPPAPPPVAPPPPSSPLFFLPHLTVISVVCAAAALPLLYAFFAPPARSDQPVPLPAPAPPASPARAFQMLEDYFPSPPPPAAFASPPSSTDSTDDGTDGDGGAQARWVQRMTRSLKGVRRTSDGVDTASFLRAMEPIPEIYEALLSLKVVTAFMRKDFEGCTA